MPFQIRDAFVLEQELCFNSTWQRKQSFHFRLRSLCFLLLNSYGWFLNFEVGCRLESEKKAGDPCEPPALKVIGITGRRLWRPPAPVPSFWPFPLSRLQG